MSFPKTINWIINGTCNANCPVCFSVFNDKLLSLENSKMVVDKLSVIGIKKITLTGGEPLLYPRLLNLIEYISEKEIAISLHTNGLTLDEDMINRLSKIKKLRISLALDGSSNEINQKIRNIANFRNLFEEKIIKIIKLKIPWSLKTIVTRENLFDIQKIAQNIKKYQPDLWLLSQFKPIKGSLSEINSKKYLISEAEFESIKKNISEQKLDFPVIFRSKKDHSSQPYFFIDSDGKVFTSGKNEELEIGDIFMDDVKALWQLIKNNASVNKKPFKNQVEIK